MIGKRGSRPRLGSALLLAAVVCVGLVAPTPVRAKHPGETPDAANGFLDRFVGHWIGEGSANRAPISDDLVCERVLDGTFLFMQDREIGGNFEADT